MKMQMVGGGFKAFSDTKHTPEAMVQKALPQHIKDEAPPYERPLGTHYIQFIYISSQTNTWLHMLNWTNDKGQMCPP